MKFALDAYILSTPIDIYTALAIEQILFDRYQSLNDLLDNKQQVLLLFWRSSPSVVIGRNQNPWCECDVLFLQKNGINLARRDTGGGSVYHDEGNLNISVITSMSYKNGIGVEKNLQILVRALKQSHGITACVSSNNDVVVNDKKITGSAMRIVKNTLLHHFTVLLNAELITLRKALKPRKTLSIKTKAVSSRPQSVSNIHCASTVLIDAYVNAFGQAYKTSVAVHPYKGLPHTIIPLETLQNSIDRFSSEQWIFHRTPEFSILVPIDNDMYEVLFMEGKLCCVKGRGLTVTPSSTIYLNDNSLKMIADNHTEKPLIKCVGRILHQHYYC